MTMTKKTTCELCGPRHRVESNATPLATQTVPFPVRRGFVDVCDRCADDIRQDAT